MNKEEYEVITVYRGRDSVTYEAEDYYKNGDNATPLAINQWPGDKQPFVKIKSIDSDGIGFYKVPEFDDADKSGEWDKKALRKLLED